MSLLRMPGDGAGSGMRPRRQLFRRAPVDPTGADPGGRPTELGPPAGAGPDVRLANFRRMMSDMKDGGGGVKQPPVPDLPMPMSDGGGGAVKPGFIGSGAAEPAPNAPGAGFDIMDRASGGINGGAALPKPDFSGGQGFAMAKAEPPPASQLPPSNEDMQRPDEQSYF